MSDVFDLLMISLCDICEKPQPGAGTDDAYGQPSQELRTKITAWPCRVSTMKGGMEYKVGKEFAKNTFKVFMRPPTVDDSDVPYEVTTHSWLKLTHTNGLPLATPFYLNVVGVNDPSLLGHHLECISEQVIP